VELLAHLINSPDFEVDVERAIEISFCKSIRGPSPLTEEKLEAEALVAQAKGQARRSPA